MYSPNELIDFRLKGEITLAYYSAQWNVYKGTCSEITTFDGAARRNALLLI
jgi:hypothetical protein